MDINEYFEKLKDQSNNISNATLIGNEKELAECHYLSSCLFDFTEEIINANEEPCALKNAVSQFETSIYCLGIGLYRQANSCLRLGFELALGSIQFSANKLEYLEWQLGKQDVKWNRIIDKENGVLSTRFSNVFNPDLIDNITTYNTRASLIYRKLSEYVHGNNDTWNKDGLELSYKEELSKTFFDSFKVVTEIVLFSLCVRYLKDLDKDNIDFIRTELSHIEPIRIYLGGPK
ncbi:hypothetical protein [Psychroserpens algicola]|uniref:hypothetical protein n=1 Tax=Psychroserpens algicola TaxID=1719034 RepID=UPI0019533B97|nr:hypothetical protein [Psychroserpens algicola]